MPGKGYSTIGLKPSVLSLLESLTNTFYPGMFLPSTLIILMNEIKLDRYSVESHKITVDLSGRYNTLTIRSDVKSWLEDNYQQFADVYEKKYKIKCFAHFTGYFLANLFESKFESQQNVIRLKESDFEWLQKEYQKHCRLVKNRTECMSFERFADTHINEILQKIRTAKEILTI